MIDRQNYLDTRKWLAYQRDVRQLAENTLNKYRGSIRHLLEWADETVFPEAHKIRPVFPRYLTTVEVVRNYKPTGKALSKTTQELACMLARHFFRWAKRSLPEQYRDVSDIWIDTLRPVRLVETVRERELYTLDEVLALTKPDPNDGLRMMRDKAAIALLFLSGMRVGAFVTLPIKALDLDKKTVKQWPEWGVETKNKKAATTFLLDIPELLNVAKAWDDIVRPALPPDAVWYARLNYDPKTGEVRFDSDTSQKARRRGMVAYILKEACNRAGIPYRSPHKLRHGHAIHTIKNARTIAEFKAISQNLMHADLKITDAVYGVLTEGDVQSRITGLSERMNGHANGELIEQLEILLQTLKNGK
jgi:site-specific recombinase XerD